MSGEKILFCYIDQCKRKKKSKRVKPEKKCRKKLKNEKKQMKKKTQTTDIPAFKVSKFHLFTFAPMFTTFFEHILLNPWAWEGAKSSSRT